MLSLLTQDIILPECEIVALPQIKLITTPAEMLLALQDTSRWCSFKDPDVTD